MGLVGRGGRPVLVADIGGERFGPRRVAAVDVEHGSEAVGHGGASTYPDAGAEAVLGPGVEHLVDRQGITTDGTPASSARLFVPCAPEWMMADARSSNGASGTNGRTRCCGPAALATRREIDSLEVRITPRAPAWSSAAIARSKISGLADAALVPRVTTTGGDPASRKALTSTSRWPSSVPRHGVNPTSR